MSETFIVDEWLWSDLNGENGENKQKETLDFLDTLYKKCDRIAVARGSKFQQKEWDFSKNAVVDVIRHGVARLYFAKIKVNPQKYEEIKIEEQDEFNLEGINRDDIYLVRTYNKTKVPIINYYR